MTGRERVLAALNRQEPDKVPWIETYVHDEMVEKLVGHLVDVPRQVRINPAVYEVLTLDNLNYNFKAPDFAETRVIDGIDYVGQGLIKSRADLDKIRLADPTKDEFYRPALEYLDRFGGHQAAMANLRSGPANTYLSMGMDVFSYALYDDPGFVEKVLDIFADWYAEVAGNLARLGFDFAVVAEDLSDKSGPIFSPAVVREFFLPRMKRVADRLEIPWIWHSDGNVGPLLDDMLALGMAGIGHLEPPVNDVVRYKEEYGEQIAFLGNIDLHYTLTRGTPAEVEEEVRERMGQLGPGGGYLLASSNGLTSYCKPENLLAMRDAREKYGHYPL